MAIDPAEYTRLNGSPLEGYEFTCDGVYWRYTSAPQDLTFNGNTFTAAAIGREAVELQSDISRGGVLITATRRLPFALQYVSGTPPGVVYVTVYRKHETDAGTEAIWNGRVASVDFSETRVAMMTEPSYTSLRRIGLRRGYQRACPHELYNPNTCRVAKGPYEVTTTIAIVSGAQVYSTAFASYADNWFRGGYVQINRAGAWHKRMITAHQSGWLTLSSAVVGTAVGDAIKALPGCDRTIATCNSKFGNRLNHGGFPYIPVDKNPFSNSSIF